MTLTVTHAFHNPIGDEPGFLGTKPSDWNAVHVVTGSTGSGLIPLDTALNLYVATTGSDSNDGLTALTPFKTIQHAVDYAGTKYVATADPVDWGNGGPIINIAAGTYDNAVDNSGFPISINPMAGPGQGVVLVLGGVFPDPSQVIIKAGSGHDGIVVQGGASLAVTYLTIEGASDNTSGTAIVYEQFTASCYHSINQLYLNGNWTNYHIGVNGGFLWIDTITINGTATNGMFWAESANAYIFYHHGPIWLNVDPHWSQGIIEMSYQARASFKCSVAGPAVPFTGPTYTIIGGCQLLHTFGDGTGISTLPPNIAGQGADVELHYQSPGPFTLPQHPNRAEIPAGINYKTPATTSPAAITLGDYDGMLLLKPAGTVTDPLTVTLTQYPNDGQVVEIQTTQIINSLTLSPNSGQSVVDAPTTLTAGQRFSATYRKADTTWYCGVGGAAGSSTLTVGTTPIASGTAAHVVYEDSGNKFGEAANFTIVSGDPNVTAGNGYRYDGTIILDAQRALQNYYLGEAAGNLTATGFWNLGLSYNALSTITSGHGNICLGPNAGSGITSGNTHIAIGYSALTSVLAGVDGNVAIGQQALGQCTAGHNTAIGESAGLNITTGTGNVAIGQNTIAHGPGLTCTGTNNLAVGAGSLFYLASGYGNISFGANALEVCTSGFQNSASGAGCLQSLTTGSNNAGEGALALANVIDGINNIGIGAGAGQGLVHANGNICLGFVTIGFNDTGDNNTAIGSNAMELAGGTATSNTAIGFLAGFAVTGNSNTLIGNSAGQSITSGSYNTLVGTYTGTTTLANNVVLSDGQANIAFQYDPTNGVYIKNNAAFLLRALTTLTDNAAGNLGTLTNAPAVGPPTKWFAIDDNGVTRYIPAW